MRYLLSIIVLLSLGSCRYGDAEVIDINGMPIHSELVGEFTQVLGRPYELFIRRNWISDAAAGGPGMSYTDTVRNGIVFRRVNGTAALQFYNRYKNRSLLKDKYIFLSNSSYTNSGELAYDIVVIKANNQFQALKLMNTNGLKQEISHAQIFEFLADLHEKNPIEIYLLEEHRIGIYLERSPDQHTRNELAAISPNYELKGKTLELYWPG